MSEMTRKFHLSWVSKDLLKSENPLVSNGVKTLENINPDWEIDISVDEEIDEYLKNTLEKKDYLLLENEHVVAKCDVWRLLKLYIEGGVYLDVDRYCNIAMKDIIKDGVKCILPTYKDSDFSHDIMISEKENPIFMKALELNLSRRNDGHKNVYYLGPQTYMHSVSHTLTGKIIDTNPDKRTFESIRSIIEKTPFLDTYREVPPYDTVLYRHDGGDVNLEKQKRELYREFSIGHWTNQW